MMRHTDTKKHKPMKNIVFLDEYSLNAADLSAIRRLGNYTGYPSTEPEQIIERAANAEISSAVLGCTGRRRSNGRLMK